MKIGILTFHWATNYGAVLQTYATQRYLESKGHQVSVINYKPHIHDDNIINFILYRKFLKIRSYLILRKKEDALTHFRNTYLHLTPRFFLYKDISEFINDYDVIISGSDQVLNPSFLNNGEKRREHCPAYFLNFPFAGKRIGYAVSFGCSQYPIQSLTVAKEDIKAFDHIGVRENTGLSILQSMGRNDGVVVPDPTSLLSYREYENLTTKYDGPQYTYCFFIRNIQERKKALASKLCGYACLWNNDDDRYTLESWLTKIRYAKFVVTDSFHCIMMCLKFHIPFAVITEMEGAAGMNDRFTTILSVTGQLYRLLHKSQINKLRIVLQTPIDWDKVDISLHEYSALGVEFYNRFL